MSEYINIKEWSDEKNSLAQRISINAYAALEGLFTRKWDADRDIAMLIAKNNGYVLKDLNRSWYKDREVAIEAVASNMSAFNLCPREWSADKSFLLDCAKRTREVQSVRDGLTQEDFNYHFDKHVINKCSEEIQELCRGKDSIQALNAAIKMENLQTRLKEKAPSPRKGLKI